MNKQVLDISKLKAAIPKNYKRSISDSLYLKIAKTIKDNKDVGELIEDNFVNFADTLKDGRYTVEEYLNAIMYVSLILAGLSDKDAYARVFPERMKRLQKENKDVRVYTSAYKRTKLVSGLLEHCIIPSWILNQGAYQKAINTQVYLMENAKSEIVRCKAAEVLINHLKKPEEIQNQEIQININTEIDSLQDTLARLAQQQLELIKSGKLASEVVEAVVINEEKQ